MKCPPLVVIMKVGIKTVKIERLIIMFESFKPIAFKGNTIFIKNKLLDRKVPYERKYTMEFNESIPTIYIEEDGKRIANFIVEPIKENPDLSGQYIHLYTSVTKDFIFMMDGIITKNSNLPDLNKKRDFEGVRFQPLFLANCKLNIESEGKGLFDRGLHYSGQVTPGNVRLVCICDFCKKSFSISSFHTGFSESQYFYSEDGLQTLVVNLWDVKGVPGPLASGVDVDRLKQVEKTLPKPTYGKGRYKYYNSFRCPHCQKPYIDFEKFPELRTKEYYGNVFINKEAQVYRKEEK